MLATFQGDTDSIKVTTSDLTPNSPPHISNFDGSTIEQQAPESAVVLNPIGYASPRPHHSSAHSRTREFCLSAWGCLLHVVDCVHQSAKTCLETLIVPVKENALLIVDMGREVPQQREQLEGLQDTSITGL